MDVAEVSGLLSNQGEKSINFYFIIVPLRKKVLKYGTPKPRFRVWESVFRGLRLSGSSLGGSWISRRRPLRWGAARTVHPKPE